MDFTTLYRPGDRILIRNSASYVWSLQVAAVESRFVHCRLVDAGFYTTSDSNSIRLISRPEPKP